MKRSLSDRVAVLLGSGFGLGLVAPFAPGTFGSLPGVALAYALALLPVAWQIVACLVLTLAAIPICGRAEKVLGIVDDGRISADEWMLYPIAVIGLPLLSLPWWSMVVFFCVTRIVDIIKPPPARSLQRLPGGLGIVIDDFFANLYSLGINWSLLYFLI